GAGSVLILDLDAHCGGGTTSLIEREPRIWQSDVSVSGLDGYPSTERARLTVVETSSEYLSTVVRMMRDLEGRGFGLCLYNAGMDPFEHCPIGGRSGIDRSILAEREAMVFEWCAGQRVPIAFVLAGGYIGPNLDERDLVALHRLTLRAARR